MKKLYYLLLLIVFCSCEKKYTFTCTDKVYDDNHQLIYKSEEYTKIMTDTEWNIYIETKRTKNTSTGCCKPHKNK